jgi:hypothetical protein
MLSQLSRPSPISKNHPRIEEFLEKLAGPQGLNLQKHFDLDADHVGRCSGSPQCPAVRRILATMGFSQVAIEECLLYCRAHKLGCDCTIFVGIREVEGPYEYDIGEYRRLIDLHKTSSQT